jgi:hypothetical protein
LTLTGTRYAARTSIVHLFPLAFNEKNGTVILHSQDFSDHYPGTITWNNTIGSNLSQHPELFRSGHHELGPGNWGLVSVDTPPYLLPDACIHFFFLSIVL